MRFPIGLTLRTSVIARHYAAFSRIGLVEAHVAAAAMCRPGRYGQASGPPEQARLHDFCFHVAEACLYWGFSCHLGRYTVIF